MTEEKAGIAAALAAFQAAMPHVGKDNTAIVKSEKASFSYKFADLTEITAALLPLLVEQGLAWTARPTLNLAGEFVLDYELMHTSGESIRGAYPLGSATAPPQQMGSAITYARRYALCAVTGLAPGGEDDDAQAAQQARSRAEAPAEPPYRTVPPVAKAVKALASAGALADIERMQQFADGYFESGAWSDEDMQAFNDASDKARERVLDA